VARVLAFEANAVFQDVTLVTTSEAVAISTPLIISPRGISNFLVFGWAIIQTGANATSYTVKIRRGLTVAGSIINQGNQEADGLAAAKTSEAFCMGLDQQLNESRVQYSLTVVQQGATGNGAVKESAIVVIAF
jgi:hypothetical protein